MKPSRRRQASVFVATVILGASLVASPARAQGDAAKLEQATKLYEEATKLLDERRYDEACPKLEQAVALVPVASGAQLALGACYEGKGKLGSAFRRYGEAAALAKAAGQAEREQRARDALAAISPRVARVTLRIGPHARAAQGLAAQLDGAEWPQPGAATPQPVDAGDHRLHVEAPGFIPVDEKLSVADGDERTVDLDLAKAPTPPPPPPVAPPPSAPAEPGSGWTALETLGVVVGGVGVAGLAVGGVTGILAIGKKSDGDDPACVAGPPIQCPPDAVSARDDGLTFATISTIGFIAGGALLAGGVVLFVVGGDEASPTSSAHVTTEIGPGSVRVSGSF